MNYLFSMLLLLFINVSCQNKINQEKFPRKLITEESVDVFKINSSIKKYDLSKYGKVIDTLAFFSEMDTAPTKGKKIVINQQEYLCLWLQNDTICEIYIRASGYSTKDGITVDLPLKELLPIINGSYEFDAETHITFMIPKKKLVLAITNSEPTNFTAEEINDLAKGKISIKKDKLDKMKIDYIRLITLR